MATERKIKKGSSDHLIEALRFIPKTYTIELSGYGGEIVMGTVSKETYDYLTDNEIHIDHLVQDYGNDIQMPAKHRIFSNGAWYDCNDICHEIGVEFSNSGTVTVYDEHGDVVWESSLDPSTLKNTGCRADVQNVFNTDKLPVGSIVYVGQSFEKGTFFRGEINLDSPFNHKKLGFGYASVNTWNLGAGVEYDDEYIENEDMNTVGKDITHELIVVEDITLPGVQMSNYRPQDWELSQEWPGTTKPVHVGWYRCVYATDDFTLSAGQLMWIGDTWMTYRRGKLAEVKTVRSWQGLNWDTSDMSNRPTKKV